MRWATVAGLAAGLVAGLVGCAAVSPGDDAPPALRALNGVEVTRRVSRDGNARILGTVAIPGVEPGAFLELRVDAGDADDDRFGVWFPGTPGRVDFDPFERQGAILTPEAYPLTGLVLELRELEPSAIGAAYVVVLRSP